ncbi:RHS repeat-associated core domain-containing protein [Mucilaginibacter sp. 3215]|uniref:RHS repeat-associated core domain-containing protein n=1 Tax=Mucilaginibacter sp. 3215 TaxID=3373912 RepID=UPI003D240001
MTVATITLTLPNKNLYNGGSEWQNDYSNAPDYYQTLNCNNEAALGRFIAVDPMAETTESMSVYQYANNNPVMMNDPKGSYALPLSNVVYYQGQMTFGPGISRRDFKRAFAAMWGIWDNSTFFGEGDYAPGGIVEELMSVGGGAGSSAGGSGSSSGGGASGSEGIPVTADGKTALYNAAEISIFYIQTL